MLKKIKSWRVQGSKQASLVLAALEILALLAMQTPTVSAEAFDTDAGTPQRLWKGGSGDSWEGWELWEPWEPDGAQEPEEPWEQEDPWEPEETREFWKTGESDELLTNLAGTGPAGEKEELRASGNGDAPLESETQKDFHLDGRLTSVVENLENRQSMMLGAEAAAWFAKDRGLKSIKIKDQTVTRFEKAGSLANSFSVKVLLKPHESADLALSGRLRDRYWPDRWDGRGDLEAAEALSVSYRRRVSAISGFAGVTASRDHFASKAVPEKARRTDTFSLKVDAPPGIKTRFGYTNRVYPLFQSKSWRSLAMNLAVARPLPKTGRVCMAYDLRQKTSGPDEIPRPAGTSLEYLHQTIRVFWVQDHLPHQRLLLSLRGDRRGDRRGGDSRWMGWEASGRGSHWDEEGYSFGWEYRLVGDTGEGASTGPSITQIFRGMASRKYGTSRLSLGVRASYKDFQEDGSRRSDYLARGLTAAWEEHLGAHWIVGIRYEVSEKYFPGNTAEPPRGGVEAVLRYRF